MHHRVPGGAAESSVRRSVILADVRLELDDPTHAPLTLSRPVPDEPRPEQRGRGLERRLPDERGRGAQATL
jgi:hypothetical protein